jgi:hypothetical protein
VEQVFLRVLWLLAAGRRSTCRLFMFVSCCSLLFDPEDVSRTTRPYNP